MPAIFYKCNKKNHIERPDLIKRSLNFDAKLPLGVGVLNFYTGAMFPLGTEGGSGPMFGHCAGS